MGARWGCAQFGERWQCWQVGRPGERVRASYVPWMDGLHLEASADRVCDDTGGERRCWDPPRPGDGGPHPHPPDPPRAATPAGAPDEGHPFIQQGDLFTCAGGPMRLRAGARAATASSAATLSPRISGAPGPGCTGPSLPRTPGARRRRASSKARPASFRRSFSTSKPGHVGCAPTTWADCDAAGRFPRRRSRACATSRSVPATTPARASTIWPASPAGVTRTPRRVLPRSPCSSRSSQCPPGESPLQRTRASPKTGTRPAPFTAAARWALRPGPTARRASRRARGPTSPPPPRTSWANASVFAAPSAWTTAESWRWCSARATTRSTALAATTSARASFSALGTARSRSDPTGAAATSRASAAASLPLANRW